MKLVHLSDLHLGKRVNEFSLIEDQRHILNEILKIIDAEQPDAVLIAGDIYDKSVPSAEAVALFDSFLVSLAARSLKVCAVSGNHDSPERVSFGGRLMSRSGVHIAPVYSGMTEPVRFADEYGAVNVYMLPFVKPANVRRFFPEREIESYTAAVSAAIDAMNVDTTARNVLVTHQFVTGAERCESEELSVGGTDNVDASVFAPFDYVALGHIHGPQKVGRDTLRYCGTPLKYSFSEARHVKSVTVVELHEKGSVDIRAVPLTPLHDMTEIKGSYDELSFRDYYADKGFRNDYLHITLTDEEDVPDAVSKLRTIYPNIMKLDYDNSRTRAGIVLDSAAELQRKSKMELIEELFEKQNGRPMGDEQRGFAQELIEKIWEGDK
ncbi:MAG: exonuclease SbcCD subunit D [Oscillospiraceae bacterium]|nr:exonuclease SbcCD subunit D [Oscillospiraceae bacterium]